MFIKVGSGNSYVANPEITRSHLHERHCDRDIADRLIISESTVKFHMNNVLKKLKAQTRYQALHQAIVNGSIQ